jgi:hypothetical protein
LGNQLFQIAAGQYYSKEYEILLDIESNNPDLSDEGKPTSLSFQFSKERKFEVLSPFPKLIHRMLSLNLRSNLVSQKTWNTVILGSISKIAIEFYLSIKFLKRFHLMTPSNVGTLPVRKGLQHNIFMNGYFQSGLLLSCENVSDFMKSGILRFKSNELVDWIERARHIRPIVVHYRLGDYANHPGMGVLNSEYFIDGIRTAREQANEGEVWLFSDDPVKALTILKAAGFEDFVVVPTFDASSTLELMRWGSAYVLSNSTFSWWAANLRYDSEAKVWAPNPWFKFQESPESIHMHDWILLQSWRDEHEINAVDESNKGAD